MRKQQFSKLTQLADLVGDFIRYWGFRKIHGEIWTLVFLSKEPLSGAEIVGKLKVSKALVSPALRELEREELIFEVPSENSKTKRYRAEENVEKIIRSVLNRREKPLMEKIRKSFAELNDQTSETVFIEKSRLEKLGLMIQNAQVGLLFLTDSDELWK